MARDNFSACLAETLPHEGGYVNHPDDPGGHTNKGVTLATMRRFYPGATVAQLRAITPAQLRRIYEAGYWKPINGDLLPAGVDLTVFDYGVNSGPSRAAKDLQRVVGVPADGRIGPKTVTATVASNGKTIIQGVCARRLSFMQGLRIWQTFKRGWSRRVASIEAASVAMWLASRGWDQEDRAVALESEAEKAKTVSEQQGKGAAGVGGGGALAGGGDMAASGEPNWTLVVGLVLLALVVGGVLLVKAKRNRERAEAYREAAAAV